MPRRTLAWLAAVFGLAGLFDNMVWVHMMTWIQKVTPSKLLGRVMSVFMFLSVGLLPVANALAGVVFEWNLEVSMIIASGVMVVVCLACAFHPNAYRTKYEGEEYAKP